MQFIITAYDGEKMLEKRMAVRSCHLESMANWASISSALEDFWTTRERRRGSALILDFEDRATLDEYLRNEPYVTKQVWEKIEVVPLNHVIFDVCKL